MKVNIDAFAYTFRGMLKEYTDDVALKTLESVDEVSKEAKKIVKDHAPVEKKGKRKGKYKRSISVRTAYESLTEKRNVIYASGKEYRLTHLLEKGHAKVGVPRNGKARVEARPHWKYGDEYIKKELPKRVKKKIGGIK